MVCQSKMCSHILRTKLQVIIKGLFQTKSISQHIKILFQDLQFKIFRFLIHQCTARIYVTQVKFSVLLTYRMLSSINSMSLPLFVCSHLYNEFQVNCQPNIIGYHHSASVYNTKHIMIVDVGIWCHFVQATEIREYS